MCQTGGVELVWWACSTHGHDANLDKHAHEKNLRLHAKCVNVAVCDYWEYTYMKSKINYNLITFRESVYTDVIMHIWAQSASY